MASEDNALRAAAFGSGADLAVGSTVLDVDALLDVARDAMADSQLVNTEAFTLLEAMTAVELGDPKMDIGLRVDKRRVGNPAELVQAGFAPLELGADDLMCLMDELLASEVSWYRGHFMAETVYSCLYMHDMQRLEGNWIIKACCEITRLTCSKIVSIVMAASTSEEEDFCVSYHGLPLHSNSKFTNDAKHWLDFSRDVVGRLKRVVQSWGSDQDAFQPCEEFPILGKMSKEATEGIIARLELRSAYLRLLNQLGPTDNEATIDTTGLDALTKDIRRGLEAMVAYAGERAGASDCFVPYLNRADLPPVPPRVISHVKNAEVAEYFGRFLDQVTMIAKTSACGSLAAVQQMLGRFSKTNPEPVARSLMAISCVQPNLKGLVCSSLGIPLKVFDYEPELFCCLEKCVAIAEVHLRAGCHNVSQQHRKLRKVSRFINDNIDQVAELINTSGIGKAMDESESTPDLAMLVVWNWLNSFAHSVAFEQLLLGFDIDIYESADYLMIYWYCEYLLTNHITSVQEWSKNLNRLGEVTTSKGKGARKNKKQGKIQVVVDKERAMSMIILLEGTRLAFNGLVRMIAALKQQGYIQIPEPPYSSEEQRFTQRFANMFPLLYPEPLSYDQFAQATDVASFSDDELADFATASFQNSLKLVNHMRSALPAWAERRSEELECLQRVCVSNNIAMKVTKRVTNGNLRCQFEMDSGMLILKLTRKAP